MQRTSLFVRNASRAVQVRFGSSGAPEVYSTKWVRAVRAESNILSPEDPPRAPLSDHHDTHVGSSDFANWVERHNDVSLNEAVLGVGSGLLFFYGIYRFAAYDQKTKTPDFVKRDLPTVENDIPTMPSKHFGTGDRQ